MSLLTEDKITLNASTKAGPVFDFIGTIHAYFDNTSIQTSKYR